MTIKVGVGKLRLPLNVGRYFRQHTNDAGFDVVSIELAHIELVETLPHRHGDPFDRFLVAQAMKDNLAIISMDKNLASYGVKQVW